MQITTKIRQRFEGVEAKPAVGVSALSDIARQQHDTQYRIADNTDSKYNKNTREVQITEQHCT